MTNGVQIKQAKSLTGAATRMSDLFDTLDMVMDDLARHAAAGGTIDEAAAVLEGAGLGSARTSFGIGDALAAAA